MQKVSKISFDMEEIASALKITSDDVRKYFTDGRRISFIIERRLKQELHGWELAPSEGASYDLIDPDGKKWEVRSITRHGVYFTPSKQVGSGRHFNKSEFLSKLREIEGFILADIEGFPEVEIFFVLSRKVEEWFRSGFIGRRANISHDKILERLKEG